MNPDYFKFFIDHLRRLLLRLIDLWRNFSDKSLKPVKLEKKRSDQNNC